MDAVEYLKTLHRMCDYKCDDCEFGERSGGDACAFWQKTNPEEAVAIAEQWAKEHPAKTRQSEFLKHYPDAKILSGCLHACPKDVFDNTNIDCNKQPCFTCKKEFWLAEVDVGAHEE